MAMEELGTIYQDGELVVRQGEKGDCMYVIQSGKAEVFREEGERQIPLRVASKGEFFGEMSLLEGMERSASVRAVGETRILTIDKDTFMRRIQEYPSLAYKIMEGLAHEVRRLAQELSELKTGTRS